MRDRNRAARAWPAGLRRAMALAIAAIALQGCVAERGGAPDATGGAQPGETPRFRNWWNYYDYGVDKMLRDDMPGARADFEACLGLRSGARFGNPRDARRVRTYGVLILDGYFPNRELGICLFYQGDYAGAARHLETSLEQAPSARATHYLNRVRQQQVRGKTLPEPRIALGAGKGPVLTRAFREKLQIAARSDAFISSLTLNSEELFVNLAEKDLAIERELRLREGSNRVAVSASDLAGRTVQTSIVIVADWTPPQLVIRAMKRQGANWLVDGFLTDETGIKAASRDGISIAVDAAPRTLPVQATLAPDGKMTVLAEDLAGNTAVIQISPRDRIGGGQTRGPAAVEFVQAPAAERTDGRPAAVKADADELPPALEVAVSEVNHVDYEFFLIDGQAADDGGLASLRIAGEESLRDDAAKGCVFKKFSKRVQLEEGTNRFEVVARDTAGNLRRKAFTVIRREPLHLRNDARLVVAMPGVAGPDGTDLASAVDLALQKEITRIGRFRMVNRSNLDAILLEQKMSVSKLGDPSARLTTGRLLAADYFFLSRLKPEGRGASLTVEACDTETSETTFFEDVYSETFGDELQRESARLAMKLSQRFPYITSPIVRVDGDSVEIAAGRNMGIGINHRFLVLDRRGEDRFDALLFTNALVQARIARAGQTKSTAQILPAAAAPAVKEGQVLSSK